MDCFIGYFCACWLSQFTPEGLIYLQPIKISTNWVTVACPWVRPDISLLDANPKPPNPILTRSSQQLLPCSPDFQSNPHVIICLPLLFTLHCQTQLFTVLYIAQINRLDFYLTWPGSSWWGRSPRTPRPTGSPWTAWCHGIPWTQGSNCE